MDLASAKDVVDAIFDAMGVDARYGDGSPGDGDACDVILWRPQGDRQMSGVKLSGFSLAERSLYILVREAQIAAPLTNMAFRLDEGGDTYRIGEDTPVPHDIHGLAWRCAVVLEASS